MDWKLELVTVPVTDVDRAKSFYVDRVGFHPDYDHRVSDTLRFVQLTPPGSGCSIAIGEGLVESWSSAGAPSPWIEAMEPGSVQGLQLVVDDVRAARAELAERGVDVADVVDLPWGSFTFFRDPDGNSWAVQQVPPRN